MRFAAHSIFFSTSEIFDDALHAFWLSPPQPIFFADDFSEVIFKSRISRHHCCDFYDMIEIVYGAVGSS